jgi:putative transposase
VLRRPLEFAQYTAIRYTLRLDDVGAVPSIGSVGDSYDNAMAESLIGLYKNECVKIDGPFPTVEQLELATCDWVHWFNHDRLHSSIGYLTPVGFEAEGARTSHPAKPQPTPPGPPTTAPSDAPHDTSQSEAVALTP